MPHRSNQPSVNGKTREQLKTAEQRAEDLVYTINHSIVCTLTDWIDAPVNTYIQNDLAHHAPNFLKPFLAKFHIGCGHDHGTVTHQQMLAAEFIGDFGSVPIVMAAQRYAPNAMHSVETALEPIFGQAFHHSAELWTKPWAKRNGIAYNSEEYNQHVEEIYHHEMSHLPQAALWTISSIVLNVLAQRAVGNKNPWTKMAFAKTSGAVLTSGFVVGARVAAPKPARAIDRWAGKNIIVPGTRFIAKLMGVDDQAIEHVLEHQEDKQDVSWEGRITKKQQPSNLYSVYRAFSH